MTRRHADLVSLAALLALLGGCAANPWAAVKEYQSTGQWEAAYTTLRKLVADGEASRVPDAQRAVLHYELGRAAGATCRFDEAERELLLANQLDARTNGPTQMSLLELGEMATDRGQWPAAVGYYERGLAEIERIQGKNGTHPAMTALEVDKYAIALRNAGREADAAAARARALELRQLEPNVRILTDRTPYGSYCAPGTGQS
ncbi:MAG TPA: hypothetical protein VMR31_19735 [Myxococcota bacterium]|nr:hypothetical protein [Myxococcota bacterium]